MTENASGYIAPTYGFHGTGVMMWEYVNTGNEDWDKDSHFDAIFPYSTTPFDLPCFIMLVVCSLNTVQKLLRHNTAIINDLYVINYFNLEKDIHAYSLQINLILY